MVLELGRVAASSVILVLSGAVLNIACHRASTIYFFELESTRVLFADEWSVCLFPLILSALLLGTYLGTKKIEDIKRLDEEKKIASRKVSFSEDAPPKRAAEQARNVKRMLSNIEEDEIERKRSEATSDASRSSVEDEAVGDDRVDTCDERSGDNTPLFDRSPRRQVDSLSVSTSRKSSFGSRTPVLRKSSRNEDDDRTACEIYQQIGQMDLFTYVLSAMNLMPSPEKMSKAKQRGVEVEVSLTDIVLEILSAHVPVWVCVMALHVVILEVIHIQFAYDFYYHAESMQYAALFLSASFGLLHEYAGNWMSNDVLAFASIYVVISRVQLVSFRSAVILSVAMAAFDLFWLYVVDLLSTVTTKSRAPIMIAIPRNNEGRMQSLATLDIMIPGVFLSLMLKYASMYDQGLYYPVCYAAFAGLAVTMLVAIARGKVTPALVLPSLSVLATSLICASHPNDLWRFAIKH